MSRRGCRVKTDLGEHMMFGQRRNLLATVVLAVAISCWTQGAEPIHFAEPNLKAAVEGQLGAVDPTPTEMFLLCKNLQPSPLWERPEYRRDLIGRVLGEDVGVNSLQSLKKQCLTKSIIELSPFGLVHEIDNIIFDRRHKLSAAL